MTAAAAIEPRVIRASSGRLRIALAGWNGAAPAAVNGELAAMPGVTSAEANPVTGNALVRFDRAATSVDALLADLRRISWPRTVRRGVTRDSSEALVASPSERAPSRAGGAPRGHTGHLSRARIAVRGIDRDPQLARRVVERLERRPDVRRAVASTTTGRVLVEFCGRVPDVQDVLSELSVLELPALPDEDRPAHPLDPAPLIQSTARLIGSALGLGLIAVRRAAHRPGPPIEGRAPAVAAGAIGIAEGLPFVRSALRDAFGRDRAQLLLAGCSIVSLTLSGSPLGLAVNAASALRMWTEVRARRAAWEEYERRLEDAARGEPGAVVRLEAGDRVPLHGLVLEGAGTAVGVDGLPDAIYPGTELPAGARVLGGPFTIELDDGRPFTPQPRAAPPPRSPLDRYMRLVSPLSLAYAGLTVALTRSLGRGFTALLLVNPRAALIGAEAADAGASARVLRAGVTVVGTRPERVVRRPDTLVLDGPRTLTDGFEASRIVPLAGGDAAALGTLAAAVASAAGSPWGAALRAGSGTRGRDGRIERTHASAEVDGVRYELGPADAAGLDEHPVAARARERGDEALVLREAATGRALASVHIRPRLASGVRALVRECRDRKVELALREHGERRAAQAVARRADIPLVLDADLVELVRERQRAGALVAVLSDDPNAAEAFEACDLAVGLTSGRSARFPARADLLAPDLAAVAAIVEAGARHDESVAAAVALSAAANVAGAAWGLRGPPRLVRASHATYIGALAAIGVGWVRLRGGGRSRSLTARLVDPRPERWGRQTPAEVLAAVRSRPAGLTEREVEQRRGRRALGRERNVLVAAALDQIRSPLTGILAAGAGLSLALGEVGDVAMIAAVIAANAAVGAWQERQAGKAAETLQRMGAVTARVVRDGEVVTVPAEDVVRGDVLVLASGDGVVADARLLEADGLEADEAALTGESLPVAKFVDDGPDAARVVLEGSDVTVGGGRAVVVAVGSGTRLGATAAALALHETRESPLGDRLNRLFRQGLPLIAGGGVLVALAGIVSGGAPLAQVALGASIAIAAVPEGLPLLAGVAEAAVARRLSRRGALVRRLGAVEALGRVDVACCDKTGTLTQGRLALRLLATPDESADFPGPLTPALRDVLRVAAQASPHPEAADASAHPTDVAVVEAAERAGLGDEARAARTEEAPFDPTRSLHAARINGRLCVKGAPEVVVERCTRVRTGGAERELDDDGRAQLLAVADRLAERGLRVLMVAEGGAEARLEDPDGLVAIGFVGIADPLRPGVRAAIERCREAGVRLVMLTGDHPATARAIAQEAGIAASDDEILTGEDLAELQNGELDVRLEHATVVARITPLDKVRIVESLQRRGHTVAMTGDGVNDAPALRLADVGVAMGSGGTEVARQAADVVLADDDFATLVDALVEGRAFWRNIRRSLGLLLGGNLGELGLVASATVLGRRAPLTTRQILAVNLATDVLPALAVAVQPPEHRTLSELAREGTAELDAPLREEILRRGTATALPALAGYLTAGGLGAPGQTVAFASIVATQLAQTLDLGLAQGTLSRSVLAAVAGSGALLAATLSVPPLQAFLGLAAPTPFGAALILSAAGGAVLLARLLPGARTGGARPAEVRPRLELVRG
ncbi:MAG: family hydrolase [Conexibacter sp.]|nr:family hydrolase [Conexibacter sp.]